MKHSFFFLILLHLPPKPDEIYRTKLYFNCASVNANLSDHQAVVSDCTLTLKLDSEYVKAYTRQATSVPPPRGLHRLQPQY